MEYMEVESEQDALLLENNLIKEYKPRYNILLKDDKTFPWLCIKNEPYPRIFSTRNKVDDGSEYFGPYASVKLMKTLLSLATNLYPLRNCNFSLTEKNINSGKFKVCLEYHIGNCLGPCEGRQSEDEYNEGIKTIRKIIKGNTKAVIQNLEQQMGEYAADLDFERAQLLKEKLDLVKKYQSSSTLVSPTVEDAEVYFLRQDMKKHYVAFLKVVDGAVIHGHTRELRAGIAEDPAELLTYAVEHIRSELESTSKELIVALPIGWPVEDAKVTVPQRGDRKKLLELAERNMKYHILERRKQTRIIDPEQHYTRILKQVQDDLRLNELPRHIECFDNSNTQGTNPVSACVVFKDAKP
ncbi:UNVERIFIED_CONTAM: hypothetical protein GTU68_041164, partial [Idotea baltica]|nr:hypothetical protein [Idotea baltica]